MMFEEITLVDADVKAYLDEMKREQRDNMAQIKSELIAHSDNTTRALLGHVDNVKQELLDHVDNVKREVFEHNEAVETRLLGEFWKWARTADARYRQSHAVVGALDDRVQAIEDRVADLERRRAG